MELATLITETVKLTDDAHRANNAGHPNDAKLCLDQLYASLSHNKAVFAIIGELTHEGPAETQNPPPTPNGDG